MRACAARDRIVTKLPGCPCSQRSEQRQVVPPPAHVSCTRHVARKATSGQEQWRSSIDGAEPDIKDISVSGVALKQQTRGMGANHTTRKGKLQCIVRHAFRI